MNVNRLWGGNYRNNDQSLAKHAGEGELALQGEKTV